MLYRIIGNEVSTHRRVEIPNWDAPNTETAKRLAREVGIAVSSIEPMNAPARAKKERSKIGRSPILEAASPAASSTGNATRGVRLFLIVVGVIGYLVVLLCSSPESLLGFSMVWLVVVLSVALAVYLLICLLRTITGFGLLLVAVGVIGLLVALNKDTTVEVPGQPGQTIGSGEFSTYIPSVPSQRVHNIGLMDERRNWLIVSGFVLVGGVLLLGFGTLREQIKCQHPIRPRSNRPV
jgi:preprotein translocase subunit Sss1